MRTIKCDTDLHGLVELIGGREDVDAGARHPEGGNVLGHPSEVAAEAVGALSSGRAGGGPGHAVRRRVGFGEQGSEQQHGGAAGNQEVTRQVALMRNEKHIFTECVPVNAQTVPLI